MVDTIDRIKQATELDEDQLRERVKLLQRLRKMLEIQRESFRSYLNVLEKQEDSIVKGDTAAIEIQAQMEQKIVREILSVQKVVRPLNDMYNRMYPGKQKDITELQTSLSQLQHQVLLRNEQNRDLLARQRDELKKKIDSLRIPKGRKSVYGKASAPSMIDIQC